MVQMLESDGADYEQAVLFIILTGGHSHVTWILSGILKAEQKSAAGELSIT